MRSVNIFSINSSYGKVWTVSEGKYLHDTLPREAALGFIRLFSINNRSPDHVFGLLLYSFIQQIAIGSVLHALQASRSRGSRRDKGTACILENTFTVHSTHSVTYMSQYCDTLMVSESLH